MNLKHLSCIVDVDLCYDNIKYTLQAAQTSPNSYHLALNNTSLEVTLQLTVSRDMSRYISRDMSRSQQHCGLRG